MADIPGPTYGKLFDPEKGEDYTLYPETTAAQVKHMDGDILSVLPTPAEKEILSKLIPTEAGMCRLFAGEVLPKGYLWANGEYYFKSEKQDLYKVCGINFGESEDKKKFAIPRLQPMTVPGLGEDYVVKDLPIFLNSAANVQYNVIYCDDGIDPYYYFFYAAVNATTYMAYKYYPSSGRVESRPTIHQFFYTSYSNYPIYYCKSDGYLYGFYNNKIYKQKPFTDTGELVISTTTSPAIPTNISSICINPNNGDVYFYTSTGTTTGRALYCYSNSTQEITQLINLDDLAPGTGSPTARGMCIDPIKNILYFQNFISGKNGYQICTYHLNTKEVYFGSDTKEWWYNYFYTCGQIYGCVNPSLAVQQINDYGVIVIKTTTLPLIPPSNLLTAYNTLAYSPEGIPIWISTTSNLNGVKTMTLFESMVSRSLYYIIKD